MNEEKTGTPIEGGSGAVIQAQNLISSMQLAFQQISTLLSSYGIQMYIYKVKLYKKEENENKPIDDDCTDPRYCIDYIVRVKCQDDLICFKLKESLKQG